MYKKPPSELIHSSYMCTGNPYVRVFRSMVYLTSESIVMYIISYNVYM